MTYRFPQLVRVSYARKNSRRRVAVYAINLARDEAEAFDIACALDCCMVPPTGFKVRYEVSVIPRRPTRDDMHSDVTTWSPVREPESVRLIG